MEKILWRLKFAFITVVFFVVGCSKNLDDMSIEERSIHQPKRYADDHAKDEYRNPLAILKFINIEPGSKVVDLLGGGGYYTELFNYIVGESGRVYIQNNSLFLNFSRDELDQRLRKGRLKNVSRIDSEFADMRLPENVDIMFIGLSYHDIYVPRKDPVITANREEFLTQIYNAIKPGGRLIIIDHAARSGTGISMTAKLHRIDEEWTKKDLAKAGFKFSDSIDVLRNVDDNLDLDIWKKDVIYKTDRFIHMYIKVEE